MKKTKLNKAKMGFTIIEVVLVLAIAGLIFLMVFVALPALQSSQRDTQRKDNYALLATTLTSYASNNRGALPPAGQYAFNGTNTGTQTFVAGSESTAQRWNPGFLASYIREGFVDPGGLPYVVDIINTTSTTRVSAPGSATAKIYLSTSCDDGAPVFHSELGNRRYSVYGYLESGVYCQDN